MKKTLILPDIHNLHEVAQRVIDAERPDLIVCLGDFFDSFYDTVEMNRHTAMWLRRMLLDERFIPLFGNHDIPYAFSNRWTLCSGYTQGKDMAINEIMRTEDWARFRFYYNLDGILLTHAGLHEGYLPPGENVFGYLALEDVKARKALVEGNRHWFYNVGRSRCGSAQFGGIVWCDFNREFQPIEGVRQIFGHTPLTKPEWLADSDDLTLPGWNLALDTHLKHYAIWDGLRLQVNEIEP